MSKNIDHVDRLNESELNHALYLAVEFAKGDWNVGKELREFIPDGHKTAGLPGWWYCQLACDIVETGCLHIPPYPPKSIRNLASLVGPSFWYALAMAESSSGGKEGCQRVIEGIVNNLGPLRLSIFKRLELESRGYIESESLNILYKMIRQYPVYKTSEEIFQAIEIDQKLGKNIRPELWFEGIRISIKENNLHQAIQKVKELHQNGIRIGKRLLREILDNLIKTKNIQSLSEYLLWIEEKGYHLDLPNSELISLVDAAQKSDDSAKLKELNELIQNKKETFRYSSLIAQHIKVGKLKKAEEIFNQMLEHDIKPDVVTYGILINGYAKAGKIPKAQDAFDQLINAGLSPEIKQYTALINAYSRKGQTEGAQKIFDQMIQQQIEPDRIIWLIDTCFGDTYLLTNTVPVFRLK